MNKNFEIYHLGNQQTSCRRRVKKKLKLKKINITLLLLFIFVLLSFHTIRSFSDNKKATEFQIKTYLVRSGDTLWDIAMKYKSPEEDPREYIHNLMQLNEMTDSEIYSGQSLEIQIPIE